MSSNGTVAHAIEQSGGELNATCHDKYVVVYDYSKTASRDVLGNTMHRSRVKDWLNGIVKQHPGGPQNTIVNGQSEAEEILSMFHLMSWRKELGGAATTPQFGTWTNVTSTFPIHNDPANKELLFDLSKKLFLDTKDFDRIRDLWGTKVAFYFAFLQTYFIFLSFLCLAGAMAWQVLPKYSLTVAIVTGVWCTVFLEYWKFQEIDFSIRWGVRGVGRLKVNRPQFQYEKEIIDWAGRTRHYFSKWKQITRQLVVIPFVLLSTLLLGLLIIAIFPVEIVICETYDGRHKFYLEYVPTVALAMLLPYFSNLLERVASAMTEYENHRTQDHYEMSLTQKIFVLNFITNYLPIFLTAGFFNTMDTNLHFESNPDKLRNEVIAFTMTGQLSNLAEELILPYMRIRFGEWWRNRRSRNEDSVPLINDDPVEEAFLKRIREQAVLPPYNVQEDIFEMVIQFGYLTLFSPVWPLIPIGFLINNWIELRSDFLKISIDHQRPAPVRADGIGPWIGSLEALTWLGSLSSAAIVHIFGTQHAFSFLRTSMGQWYSLPFTLFISEHLFLALRAGVKYALNRIGSYQIRKERDQQYVERKKYLETLERQTDRVPIKPCEKQRKHSTRDAIAHILSRKHGNAHRSTHNGVSLSHIF